MLMEVFETFSKSTRLKINPAKCKVFFGHVGDVNKQRIQEITNFDEGKLPFRYLGIPLTSKKLNINLYMPLIDKIMARINHWSSRLLSIAGRTQLTNSVLKSPIVWKKVCFPKKHEGLSIIDIGNWNISCLAKLLWNLCKKYDSMWIKWIHCFYVKNQDILTMDVKTNSSWIMKDILKVRPTITTLSVWNSFMQVGNFVTRKLYAILANNHQIVNRRKVFYNNPVRPRAMITLWMACGSRLATKDRLKNFGMIRDDVCCFCNERECQNHLFFQCKEMELVWHNILEWMQLVHRSGCWSDELN
ncbi:unnamed protein product [Lathyrus sativus]|nr:unnamed protein product [Lathyrus sativus]